jgi:hypothetical protein
MNKKYCLLQLDEASQKLVDELRQIVAEYVAAQLDFEIQTDYAVAATLEIINKPL